MSQAVVEDIEQFKAFIAQQPLCQWAAQKQRDIDEGKVGKHGGGSKKAKEDNSDLAAALASMA